MNENNENVTGSSSRRLSKAGRRQQLLETSLAIVREEDVDSLTLGRLAERAGVSKPVVYDHFPTRSALLIELYKWIDEERIGAFTRLMADTHQNAQETIDALANAYIHCAADNTGAFHLVGTALAGSEEKAAVFQELLDNCVEMFIEVLTPHVSLSPRSLRQCCIGLVGAGEALSLAIGRGQLTFPEAVEAFAVLIKGVVQPDGE
ncbi:TetR/AcrR family transcriptional regulator [Atlantibacter hermannii]|uniref:TetR/AcrR family transcriptional regulator n=1 Tax=Atlantibacter hermannii TaxID=565 RepID=UPI0028024E65|nr:TetR/AcrR family transcriptional regulator [Atlantibacter hermannii]MDQ7883279.1 TetR/AcrR family transcriptional regulator [Atlantibacter hermannii]